MTQLDIIELIGVTLVTLAAMFNPTVGWLRTVTKRLSPISTGWSAIILVAAVSLVINASIGLFIHMPVPAVHDEFANLLGADTFASARLTNPAHPLWEHFQTYHIVQQPTYQSKYPPAQSLVLAAGQVVFGHPIAGVWISLAVACGAVCWMLQAWVPPWWATYGAFLMAINPRMIEWWGHTYYGGGIAMLGGALMFGSVRQVMAKPRVSHAVLLALGLLLLANSRPYEGLIASLPVAILLLVDVWRNRQQTSLIATKTFLPMLVILIIGFGWMGYYNYRVTGNCLRFPYQVWIEQSGMHLSGAVFRPPIVDSTVPSSESRAQQRPLSWVTAPHAADEKMLAIVQQQHDQISAYRKSVAFPIWKLNRQFLFYFSFTLGIPLAITLPFVLRNRWMRFAFVVASIVIVGILCNSAVGNPHYSAPIAPLLILLAVQAYRHLNLWRWKGRPSGKFFVYLVPVLCSGLLIIYIATGELFRYPTPLGHYRPFHAWSVDRDRIEHELRQNGRDDVVIVRYSPQHSFYHEWVFNRADIDNADVVWARDLGPTRNQELVDYFRDREIWLLEVDTDRRLTPFSVESVSPKHRLEPRK